MEAQKIGLERMERQYLLISNLEMARRIIDRTGVYGGNCLELSAGGGYLGFALAENTLLDLYLLENNRHSRSQAELNVSRNRLGERIRVLKGSACAIPLPDGSMDLVTSKKSVFSWNYRMKTFQEVYRVLAPGGKACFCGGFESDDVKFRVEARLAAANPHLVEFLNQQVHWNHLQHFEAALKEAGIPAFKIDCHDNGMWIVFGKPGARPAGSPESRWHCRARRKPPELAAHANGGQSVP